MAVSTFQNADANIQTVTAWLGSVDGNLPVLARIGDAFSPHAQATPGMTVALDPGHLFDGVTLTEIAAQSTSIITAPTANPRIDRVVIDQLTGVGSVVSGVEAINPLAPAIPLGKVPVARVSLLVGSTAITNDMITDERDLSSLGRIIAVEAGIGLTGGGTAGTVTISLETPVAVALGGTGTATAGANKVFAGPASGADAAPSFRSLALADLPADVATTEEINQAIANAAPPVGTIRNLRMSVTAASASATIYWDEAILKSALGGAAYVIANTAGLTINLATTGAGGMDAGSVPSSGYVAIYAGYNPSTGAKCLFAQNATSAAVGNVYGGANAPAGYTATALVSVVCINGSLIKVCQQRDRLVVFPMLNVLTTQGTASANVVSDPVALSVAAAVPPNAISVGGVIGASSTTDSGLAVIAGSDANMSGSMMFEDVTARVVHGVFDVVLGSKQQLYYQTFYTDGTPTFVIHVTRYTF